jgi:hypothetical protein
MMNQSKDLLKEIDQVLSQTNQNTHSEKSSLLIDKSNIK